MADKGLIVFIRNPELGKVKTRLAQEIGAEKTLEIYNALLNFTRDVALKVDAERFLYYFEYIVDDNWKETHFHKKIQVGKDLGKKMSAAFQDVLGHCDKAIIIGSDCPQITSELIEKAYNYLNSHDLVIGPTYDGGYYLLGMKSPYKSLFKDINWSTESVFGDTLKIAKKESLTYHVLGKLSDVDHKEDWEEYGWEV